ncbi:MAG: T9SS type A sorting domain-containing protein [Bacteroidia bacterium]
MRKFITFFVSLSAVISLEHGTCTAQSAAPSTVAPLFANDITIEPNSLANQRHVRVAAAYNGWMFAAYIVNDSASGKGGVVVRYSKNWGINWMPFNNYPYYRHSQYKACDITITGSDSNHLNVFIGDVRKDLTTHKYEVEVQRYNAYHTAYAPVPVFFKQLDSNAVYDMALANDFHEPFAKDSLYSLGLAYSHKGAGKDSMLFVTTEKKLGDKFGKPALVGLANHLGKVSLAYMHSASSKGAYAAAWEAFDTITATYGHVQYARTIKNLDSAWTMPVKLDTLVPATANKTRSPSIACQNNATDNDSTDVTAAVTFDCFNGTDKDILGYYNKRADSTNIWNSFSVISTANNEIESNIIYDAVANKFAVTYYDSTTGGLVYANQGALLPTPNAWNVVSLQYNNNTTNLKAPWPRVVMNAVTNKAFFSWVMDPSSHDGVVLCDGEYLFTGIAEQEMEGLVIASLYPNPANNSAVLPVSSDKAMNVQISLFNTMGQLISSSKEYLGGGEQLLLINTSLCAPGVYLCRLETSGTVITRRLVVEH